MHTTTPLSAAATAMGVTEAALEQAHDFLKQIAATDLLIEKEERCQRLKAIKASLPMNAPIFFTVAFVCEEKYEETLRQIVNTAEEAEDAFLVLQQCYQKTTDPHTRELIRKELRSIAETCLHDLAGKKDPFKVYRSLSTMLEKDLVPKDLLARIFQRCMSRVAVPTNLTPA